MIAARAILCALAAGWLLSGQDVAPGDPGIVPPVLIRNAKPEYPNEARSAGIEGTVVLAVVIDEKGTPTGLEVIRPMGFGLDERAIAAVRRWRFKPGTKDGDPVRVLVTAEVHFVLVREERDLKEESRRGTFTKAVMVMQGNNEAEVVGALKVVQDLADEKYAPAMHLLGMLHHQGKWVEQDPAKALSLFRAAADRSYGPAIYQVGRTYLLGDQVPRDEPKGLKMFLKAARLGSVEAQYALGVGYEEGVGVAPSREQATYYFRLCAVAGEPSCQYRVAKLLLELPDRREQHRQQALVWAQLAADKGIGEAKELVARETPGLTTKQLNQMEKLKKQLTNRP